MGSPGKYAPNRPNGKRIPGWEDINVTLLAADLGISFRYLLAVLRGERNCTLALLQQTSQAIGIPITELLTRMERAYHLRQQALSNPIDKAERRRERNVRTIIQRYEEGNLP